MQAQGNVRRRYVLAVLLVLLVLLRPVMPVVRQLLPAVDTLPALYYLVIFVQTVSFWLAPALFFEPWRYQRLGEKRDVLPLALAALPVGAAIQVFSCGFQATLPAGMAASAVPQPVTAGEWALVAVTLVLAPAFCEEAFFRGSVTAHLLDVTKPRTAMLCSALLFALMHGLQSGLPGQLIVSLCAVLLMMATGRLAGAVLLHAGFNGAALLSGVLPHSPWLMLAALIPACYAAYMCSRIRWKAEGKERMSREDLTMLVILFAVLLLRML